MKINVCIRCQTWSTSVIKLSEIEKKAVITLSNIGLFEAEHKNEVCDKCRQGIGNVIADNLLKIFGDERK